MFDKREKAIIEMHTMSLSNQSLELVKLNRLLNDKDELIKKLYKDNWHINYKLSKLLEVMQLEWATNCCQRGRKDRGSGLYFIWVSVVWYNISMDITQETIAIQPWLKDWEIIFI